VVDVIAIPANRSLAYWPHVREHILKAFSRFPGEVSEEKIIQNLSEGLYTLWVAWRDGPIGGLLTQIIEYSEFDSCRIVALGGKDFESWRNEMDRVLDVYCKLHGLTRIEFAGRRGWLKRVNNYKLNRVFMVRNV